MEDLAYIIGNQIRLILKAGDSAVQPFQFPNVIDLFGMTGLFQVRDHKGNLIFQKEGPDEVKIQGQDVFVFFRSEDTANKEGVFQWELEFYNDEQRINKTLCNGPFILVKEISKRIII